MTRSSRLRGAWLFALVALTGCTAQLKDPQGPVLPPDTPGMPPFTRAVFAFKVDMTHGSIEVQVPQLEGAALRAGDEVPAYSILGADAIGLTVTDFYASPVGAIQPNKIRVQLDVQVLNKLVGYDLDTPTFPEPPSGEAGLMLIPYSSVIASTSGGVSVTGDGTVIVGLPSSGLVLPSIDWNGHATPDRPAFPAAPGSGGLPHSFFNDASCSVVPDPGAASDCFRYENFGRLAAGTLSGVRRVGFDIDASVGQFRALLLVTADLKAAAPLTPGTLTGTITSPQRGPLAGVQVDVQGVATSGSTNSAGGYSIAGIGGGARSVTVSQLPAGCDAATLTPANGGTVTVPAGGTTTLNFTVTCTPLTGQVTGQVVRTGAGAQSLSGVHVIITPAAAGVPSDTVPVIGSVPDLVQYSVTVPVGLGSGAGEGTVRLANLPAFCVAPPPASYSGLVAGGSATVSFTVQCDAPAATRYLLLSRWGTPSGGVVDLTVAFDPSGFNDPLINGTAADGFAGLQAITTLTGTAADRLTAVSGLSVSPFSTPNINALLPSVAWLVNTTAGDRFALSDVAVLRFTIGAGAPGSVTTATTLQEVSTASGDAFALIVSGAGQNVDVLEATLNLP